MVLNFKSLWFSFIMAKTGTFLKQLGILGFSILLYPRKQHPDTIVSYTWTKKGFGLIFCTLTLKYRVFFYDFRYLIIHISKTWTPFLASFSGYFLTHVCLQTKLLPKVPSMYFLTQMNLFKKCHSQFWHILSNFVKIFWFLKYRYLHV